MIYPMYINGKWYDKGEKFRDIISPSSGEVIGKIPLGTRREVDLAVHSAKSAMDVMEEMTVFERAEILKTIANLIRKNKNKLAKLLSHEQGKPYATEALDEVEASAVAFEEAGEQVKWLNSEIIHLRDRNKRAFSYRKPRGVYGVITPWNFPLGCPSQYFIAPGLAAGNSIVWVPAPSTSAI